MWATIWRRLAVMATLPLLALPPGHHSFRTFDPPNNMSFGLASGMLPDGQGGFYILHGKGVHHFEGGRFHLLGAREGLPKERILAMGALPGNRIILSTDAQLWVGTFRHFDPVKGAPSPDQLVAPPSMIRDLGLALPLKEGLFVFTGDGSRMLPAPPHGPIVDGLKEAGGRLVLLTPRHLLHFHQGQWTSTPLPPLKGSPGGLFKDHKGNLWIRSEEDLLRLEPQGGIRTFGAKLGLGKSSSPAMAEDPWGRLWVSGPEALAWVDGDTVHRLGQEEGLPGVNPCRPFHFDGTGALWTLSDLGLHRHRGGFRWSAQGRAQGLSSALVYGLCQPGGTDALFAGTADGIQRRGDTRWSLVPGTRGWYLPMLMDLGKGRLLAFGAPPRSDRLTGLLLEPGRSPRPIPLPGPLDAQSGLFGAYPCGPSEALLMFSDGIRRFTFGTTGTRMIPLALPPAMLKAPFTWCARGMDGQLWIGTPNGIWVGQGSTWKSFTPADGLAPESSTGAFPGRDGEMWVFHAPEPKITRFQNRDGHWKPIGTLDGAQLGVRQEILGGLTDRRSRVWLICDGIVHRLGKDGTASYTKAWGLPSDGLGRNLALEDPQGHIWVATTAGLAVFDDRFDAPQPSPPAVLLASAEDRDGRRLAPDSTLKSRQGGATFTFQIPIVEGGEDLMLQARLLGLHEDWQPVEGARVRHPSLRGGTYRLEVRAVSPDGRLGPTTPFAFKVSAPWYFRPWVHLLASLSLVGGVALFLRWRTWALARDKKRLEQEVAEATEELRQSHDELVQALAEVRTLSGFIPICATCKKIRNDEGYWAQIEHYLAEHTDAQFSHGMCPQCAEDFRAAWKQEKQAPQREGAPKGPQD